MAANEGSGATITFGTTGISLLATSIQGQGISWSSLDTTDLSTTTAKTFKRGATYDPGTIAVGVNWDADLGDGLIAAVASESVTITYPNTATNAATEVSTGFITSIDSGSCEVDGIMKGSVSVKRTGAVTFTDAS